MRTVRRLLYAEIVKAVVFVAVGFLSLFFFFDFVSELAKANEAGYTPCMARSTACCSCRTISTSWRRSRS